MKTLPPLRILIPIALFALACGTQGAPRVIAPVSPDTLVRTLAPDAPTLVSLQSLPDAACELSAAGVAETMKVRSDDRGVITFHALPVANADSTAQLTLTCTNAAGVQRVHPIQFEAGEAAVPAEVAAAAAIEALPHPGATVRPALVGDPNGYTSDQLVALGFPPRPSSDAAGGAYARWLSEVTQPMTVIPPNLRDSGLFHGPARGASSAPSSGGAASNSNSTSNNWSGLLLDGPKQYAAIFGWYPVPKVSAQSGFANSHSTSYWVGLDGWGSGDVVQDGSEALTVTFMWVQTTTYYAWAEYYPATESILWGFPVGPGDELGLWTIFGTQSYQITPKGNYGWFEEINYSRGTTTGLFSIEAPSNAPAFTGATAEWIMERPELIGLTTLGNYGTAQMHDTVAFDFAMNTHEWTTDPYLNLTMTNGNDVLSTMSIVDEYDLDFTWHNYQ